MGSARHPLYAPILRALFVGLVASVGCSAKPNVGTADASANASQPQPCDASDTVRATSVADFVAQMKHVWSYQPLTLEQLNALTAATRALDDGDPTSAAASAIATGYALVPLSTADACYWMLQPTQSAPVGQATLIYATGAKRNLVIEAPHAYEDRHTDREAALLFAKLQAKALVISGAHRCALTSSSGCHASRECDKTNSVPAESDPSHSVYNAVNAMHLAYRTTDAVVLQLHTNMCPDLNGDALVSNGTRYPIQGSTAEALHEALSGPGVDVRSCNDPSRPLAVGVVCSTTGATAPFCGETSTQSLSSNGAADACSGRPSKNGGPELHRFIHLEQSNWRMCLARTDNPMCIDTVDHWTARVGDALAAAIPLEP